MEIPHICRYCGGIVRLVPAESVYGDSAVRLGLKGEKLYQCQNCNARVGCHRGTIRPLGDLANEVLRLKRIETHQVFDAYWTEHEPDTGVSLAGKENAPSRTEGAHRRF